VSLVDHTSGTVSVEEVYGEEEGLGEELEGSVSLNEEVDEVRPHEPLDFLLNINRGNVRECLVLFKGQYMITQVRDRGY
jgi:hypothetical protein